MGLKIILTVIPAVCGVFRTLWSIQKEVGTAQSLIRNIEHVGNFTKGEKSFEMIYQGLIFKLYIKNWHF